MARTKPASRVPARTSPSGSLLYLPLNEPAVVRAQGRINYLAQHLYLQHGKDLRRARTSLETLVNEYRIASDVISALVRWGVLVEEETFEPGKLNVSGRKYSLSTEQVCYLAYRMSNLGLAQETANASLPGLREDLNRRRRLLLHVAALKAPSSFLTGETGLSLPPVDQPTLIPRIFASLRDGTLKSYALFDELEQNRRELYEVNRQIERLCANEAGNAAECAALLMNSTTVGGPRFEQLVSDALRVVGLASSHIGGSGGLDVVVDSPVRIAVECKNLAKPGRPELHEAGLELQRLTASEPWDLRWVVFADRQSAPEFAEELNRTFGGFIHFVPLRSIIQALDLHRKYLLDPYQAVWACIHPHSMRTQLLQAYGAGDERPFGRLSEY